MPAPHPLPPTPHRSPRGRAHTRSLRLAGAVAAGGALVLGWSPVAGAHVDPDPTSVTAGTQATVAFGVEHGCDDSPTVAMRFKVPAQVTDAKGVAKTGWTVENGAGTVTFSGGELGPHTEDHFDISFTVPAGVDRLDFPVVQQCAQGQNDWIAIAQDGQPEPDSPAPRVVVVAAGVTPTSAAEHDHAAGDHDEASTTTAAEHDHAAGDHDEASASTAAGEAAAVTTVVVAADGSDGGTSGIVYVVIGAVGAVCVATGAVMLVRRRK